MATQFPERFPNLRVSDFLAKINEIGGPAKSCRFAVRIVPAGRDNLLRRLPYASRLSNLIYVCDAVEFPGRAFSVNNIRYYGPGQQLPGNVEYGPCNLSFICSNSGIERQFFDDWHQTINPSNTYNFNYPNQYYCAIDIFQFSEYTIGAGSVAPGTPISFEQTSVPTPFNRTPGMIYNWRLYKCWPTFVNPQQVTWADDSDVLRLQVTLTYKYWDRPTNETFYTERTTGENEPTRNIFAPITQQ